MKGEDEMYEPPFILTNEMVFLTASISEKAGKLSALHPFEARPRLRRDNRIRSIHSSLSIEANSLTLSQVRSVIDGHAVMGPEKEIREVQNAYRAYEEISTLDPYEEKELLRIHGLMTEGLVPEAGRYRSGGEGVFAGSRLIFMAPPPGLVPELMGNLFAWIREKKNEIHPLILSSVFHYEFVFIHPFSDGNGRMARLWQTVLLSKWNSLFRYIPLESRIQDFQEGYYDAIAASNGTGNSDVFILFMLHRIDEILEEILQTSPGQDRESRISRLLAVMTRGETYTALELMGLMGLKTRKTFRENYLVPALEKGLIMMTQPDKPRSRNQKYRVVISS